MQSRKREKRDRKTDTEKKKSRGVNPHRTPFPLIASFPHDLSRKTKDDRPYRTMKNDSHNLSTLAPWSLCSQGGGTGILQTAGHLSDMRRFGRERRCNKVKLNWCNFRFWSILICCSLYYISFRIISSFIWLREKEKDISFQKCTWH